MLINGVRAAARTVGWTMGLLVLVIYVFAVAFKILLGDPQGPTVSALYFSSVPTSMLTLLLPGILPDHADGLYSLGQESFVVASLYLVFIVVATITIMNMLVGVLVEVVSTVSAVEREELHTKYVKTELENLMMKLDLTQNGLLSKKDVGDLLMLPQTCQVMVEVGVDVAGLIEVAEFHLFSN